MPLSEDERRSYLLGMKIMGDFGAAIAFPVVAFVLVGKWLQTKYGFEPFGIIGGFLIAIVMSVITIRKKVKWYSAEYASLKTPESLSKKK
jgi:F0F1-type ATP synthase assembly protein I